MTRFKLAVLPGKVAGSDFEINATLAGGGEFGIPVCAPLSGGADIRRASTAIDTALVS